MNFDFDRIAMLAGVESEDPKILNESAELVNESDEKRIREMTIRHTTKYKKIAYTMRSYIFKF